MWLLVRDAQADDGALATCPESAQGREAWQWTLSRVADGTVIVDTDPDRVEGNVAQFREATWVSREPGAIVAIVASRGDWEVVSSGGPWSRTLTPGDVFLAEDDRAEELRVTPAAGAADPAVSIATLLPVAGGALLRWIP